MEVMMSKEEAAKMVTTNAMHRLQNVVLGVTTWSTEVEANLVNEISRLPYDLKKVRVETPYGVFSATATMLAAINLSGNCESPDSFLEAFKVAFSESVEKITGTSMMDGPTEADVVRSICYYVAYLIAENEPEKAWKNDLKDELFKELQLISQANRELVDKTVLSSDEGDISLSILITSRVDFQCLWQTPMDFRSALTSAIEEALTK